MALPEFEKKVLLNGMEVFFLDAQSGRTPFLLMVKNGAAFDPIDKWGATYVMARMMLENSARLNSELIQQQLQELEARLEPHVEWDAIYFEGSVPPSQLAACLDLLAEIVIRPGFDEATFERVRAQVVQELQEQTGKPEVLSQQLFLTTLLEGNPYSHSVKGTLETLQNLTLADMKIQYRRLMLPNQTKLAVHYSADREDFFQAFSRSWGSWVRDDPAPFTFRRAQRTEGARVLLLDAPEPTILRWGQLGVRKGSRDYFPLRVLQQYLTLMLPSWAEEMSGSSHIRASVELQARRMPGYFQLNLQIPSDQTLVYLKKIETFLNELEEGKVDPSLLAEAKSLILQEFADSFQDPLGRLYQILESELYNLGLNYISTFGIRLNRVDEEAIREVAGKHLSPNQFLLVVSGPSANLKPLLETIGEVEFLN